MLTVKQAAERANVSTALVYQWCEERRLPHYRLGGKGKRGKLLINPADLDAFMQSLRVEAGESRSSASGRISSDSRGEPFSELDLDRLQRAWEKH
jgi:excisionase family DNA binding protein